MITNSLQQFIFAQRLSCFTSHQIPFGIMAKRFGALRFLGYGMLINSVFAFFVPIAASKGGWVGLCVIRFIQGLGEGPIVRDLTVYVIILKHYQIEILLLL